MKNLAGGFVGGLCAVLLGAFGGVGCSSSSTGSGAGCSDFSGTWDISGSCNVTVCSLSQQGCSFSMSCDDGSTSSGTVSGNAVSFTNSQDGARCSGSGQAQISGTCSASSGSCNFSASCSNGACGKPPTQPGNGTHKSCVTDSDCASGEGCYTKAAPDAYCTKLCTDNAQCGSQLLCPSLATLAEPDCRDSPNHGGQGVCQVFDANAGPNTCKNAPP